MASAYGRARDKHYQHSQNSPSTVWTINHNLNKNCNITIVNENRRVINGAIEYVTTNQVVITFNIAIAGKAFCN